MSITPPSTYHLETKKDIKPVTTQYGNAWEVNGTVFPVLSGITSYSLEMYDDSLRLPHWHPNCSELGYLVTGTLEILLWRYTGEASKYTVSPGMCWFIPQGALHSLINISGKNSEMVIGFNTTAPGNVDLPVAFNGIPAPIRDAYTSPHSQLKNWKGTSVNPLFGASPLKEIKEDIESPYRIDLSKISPLFQNEKLGYVTWAVKDNWNILNGLSIIRVILKPGTCRDPIWYPNAGTLYCVIRGKLAFSIILSTGTVDFEANQYDYVYVPTGELHTFINYSETNDCEVVGFFTTENPLAEVSLLLSTGFFPRNVANYGLVHFAGSKDKDKDPLQDLKQPLTTPYVLAITTNKEGQPTHTKKKKNIN